MAWVKLDDQFFTHRKIIDLPMEAKLIFLAGLTFSSSQLTDGVLTPGAVRTVLAMLNIRGKKGAKNVEILVQKGLWRSGENCYEIHDYLHYNPTAAQVLEKRAATALRVHEWRASNAECNAVTSSVGNAVSNASPLPQPLSPTQREPSSSGISLGESCTSASAASRASAREGVGPVNEIELIEQIATAAQWTAADSTYDPDELLAIVHCHDGLSPARLIAETIKARKWYAAKKRRLDTRLLDNWLRRAFADENRKAVTTAEQENGANGHGEGQRQHPPRRASADSLHPEELAGEADTRRATGAHSRADRDRGQASRGARRGIGSAGSGRRIIEPDWTNDGPWAAAVEESQRRLAAAARNGDGGDSGARGATARGSAAPTAS